MFVVLSFQSFAFMDVVILVFKYIVYDPSKEALLLIAFFYIYLVFSTIIYAFLAASYSIIQLLVSP